MSLKVIKSKLHFIKKKIGKQSDFDLDFDSF